MKKLALIILIVSLPLIVFFQYKNYRRFHPPTQYDFVISDSVDTNYHNVEMVDEYYWKAVEIGSFARLQWKNNGVDVRYPDASDQQEMNAAKYYNQLVSRVNYLESKLTNSAILKTQGLSNEEIKMIESGSSIEDIQWMNIKTALIEIEFGEQSEFVWKVQKQLISKGYDHKLDGLFGEDTQNAIITFQDDNEIYASGTVTEDTFAKLFLE